MLDSFAKIIQYGDTYPDLFVFSPFDEEEDWSDSTLPVGIDLEQRDGVLYYDMNSSRKNEKILTKRFVLRSEALFEKYQTQKEKYGRECNSAQAYLTLLSDALYRGVRGNARGGKLKRLYVKMEDGSIRWTWAVPQELSYIDASNNPDIRAIPVTINFLCPDPYFYELEPGVNFYYDNFDLSHLVLACEPLNATPDRLLLVDTKICSVDCKEEGLIIRDESMVGFIGDSICDLQGCITEPCWGNLGDVYLLEDDLNFTACINGSAGALSPKISFRNEWNNPELTNTTTDSHLIYNGTIDVDEYLEINLDTSRGNSIEVDTNIPGFDINDLIVDNFEEFIMEIGINSLEVEGVNGDAIFTISYLNKYHN